MTSQQAGIFTYQEPNAVEESVSLLRELRKLLSANTVDEMGQVVPAIDSDTRSGIINLIREQLGLNAEPNLTPEQRDALNCLLSGSA